MDEDIILSKKETEIEKWSVNELEEYIKRLEERKLFVLKLIQSKKQHQLAAGSFFNPSRNGN